MLTVHTHAESSPLLALTGIDVQRAVTQTDNLTVIGRLATDLVIIVAKDLGARGSDVVVVVVETGRRQVEAQNASSDNSPSW